MPLRPHLLLVCALSLASCKGDSKKQDSADEDDVAAKEEPEAAPAPEGNIERATVTERQGDVAVSWRVAPSGEVWGLATLKGVEVKPDEIQGKLFVRRLPAGNQTTEIALGQKSGLLHADIGKLDGPLTEIRYTVTVKGQKVEGVLHIPKGGTMPIVEGAEVAAKSKIKPGTKGPHGGVVQVVGEDVVEVVGRKNSGDVRVYILDDNLKAAKIGKQKVKLGLYDEKSELVELVPDERGQFFHADCEIKTNPKKITILIDDGADFDVALVGYEPGVAFVIGVVDIYVVAAWEVVVVVPAGPTHVYVGKGKGKYKHKH